MEPLIIRVSRGGRSQPVFHKIEKTPFTIGRSYDNDLIISDSTVSPQHLRIVENDGVYQIQNLSMDNGSWIGDRQIGEEPEDFHYPGTVNIGRTHLDVFVVSTPVKATKVFARMSSFTGFCSRLPTAIALLIVFFGLTLYNAFVRQAISLDWSEILVGNMTVFASPIVMATVMGFLCRIFLHRWRLALQVSIASIALITIFFVDKTTSYASYFFTSQGLASFSNLVLTVAAGIGFFAWQLTAISSISSKRAFFISMAIVGTLATVLKLQSSVYQPDFNPQPVMHTHLERVDWRLKETETSITNYIVIVQTELQAGIDAELSEK